MKSLKLLLVLGLFWAGGAQAQSTGRVVGTVTNDQGQPVASASVVVQGTRIGVVTAPNGSYLIPGVPVGAHTMVATLIGYGDATQAVTVTAGQSVVANFRLTVKAVQLEGVVAVGYGTQSRRTVTGAVSTVRAAQIAEIPTSNAIKAIQDRIPGVDIVNSGNKPGDAVSIRIRGVRSITANNDPLYVVDGVPIAGNIADFNPDDIVSIDVLKDAAATAVYGSRGANGVLLVTTKGAGTGGVQTQFTADASYSGQRPSGLPTMMNMQQYLDMLTAAANYAGVPATPRALLNDQQFAAYNAGQQTDWQKLIQRTGVQKQFQIGMNGISGATRFNLSGNYFDQTGTAVGFDFNKITGTASVDHTQGRLRLGVSSNFTHSVQATALGDGLWGAARQQTGFGLPYDTAGLIITHPDGDPLAWNPLKAVNGVVTNNTRDRLFASAFGTFKLLDGVDLRVNFGPDYQQASQGNFQGPDAIYPGQTFRSGSYNQQTQFQYILDNMLQVNRDIGSIHHIDATLLYGIQKYRQVTSNESSQQIPYDEALYYALGRGLNPVLNTGLTESALQSYMARAVYTLMDRYTISGAIRRDGASVLAPGHKWTTFPTVGAAWQLGDESFMKRFDWLNTLKLRGSYGKTGNSSVNAYQTQGALSQTLYNFGATTAPGWTLNPSNPPNPNLGWETTAQTDAALEFGVLNNRISGSADWYKQDTKDLLLTRTLPATAGFTSALQNIGSTRNTGVELQLSSINVQNWHGIRWQTDLSWAHNHNEITGLASLSPTGCPAVAPQCDLSNGWFIGQPINIASNAANGAAVNGTDARNSGGGLAGDAQRRVWYYYKMIGIWQASEAAQAAKYGSKPGQIKLLDVNGDSVINASDLTFQGNTYPKWTGSIYNRVTVKSFDLSVLANIRWGYTLFNTYIPALYGRNGNIVSDYWTPTTPVNDNPAPNLSGGTIQYGDARGYQDGSNWRIRNIQLGYTLPQELAGRMGASTARIYATATEPYIHYKYNYFDPESGYAGGSPVYRTLLVGVNVGF